jgi:protein-disulfide isomerase
LRTETVAAANAALCAEEQRGYFAFGQTLFTQPDQLGSLTETGFLQAATAVGLDTAVFQQCLDEGRYTPIVLDNMAAARQAGVSATPTFFINGRKLEGAYPFSAFQQQITALLGL